MSQCVLSVPNFKEGYASIVTAFGNPFKAFGAVFHDLVAFDADVTVVCAGAAVVGIENIEGNCPADGVGYGDAFIGEHDEAFNFGGTIGGCEGVTISIYVGVNGISMVRVFVRSSRWVSRRRAGCSHLRMQPFRRCRWRVVLDCRYFEVVLAEQGSGGYRGQGGVFSWLGGCAIQAIPTMSNKATNPNNARYDFIYIFSLF